MKINIKATNTFLTPAISDYVTKRIDSLEKFADKTDETLMADVEVGKTSQHHQRGDVFRAEINLRIRGKQLRAVAEEADLYAAIDKVRDEMAEELRSSRKKDINLMRRGGAAIKNLLRFGRKDN